jgi:phage terminase small subunit
LRVQPLPKWQFQGGAMSNNPKPTIIHLIEGTGRKSRLEKRKGELLLENSIPDAPDWMPPEAQREWGRLTAESQYSRALAKVDRAMLAVYCTLWARFVAGEQPDDPKRPARDRLTPTELMVMVNVGGKLGLNPCDRIKLRTPEAPKKGNKFDGLEKP